MSIPTTEFDLKVRYQIYRFFAEHCKAPSVQEIAEIVGAEEGNVRVTFHRLHENHMIFLEPGLDMIRIANPFSAIPTLFQVRLEGRSWWANCAWDSLGIAAALGKDAEVEAASPDSQGSVEISVIDGEIVGNKHVVHFPLPCHQWYDDLIYT